jgi:hypothetical protein
MTLKVKVRKMVTQRGVEDDEGGDEEDILYLCVCE